MAPALRGSRARVDEDRTSTQVVSCEEGLPEAESGESGGRAASALLEKSRQALLSDLS